LSDDISRRPVLAFALVLTGYNAIAPLAGNKDMFRSPGHHDEVGVGLVTGHTHTHTHTHKQLTLLSSM